MRALWEAGTLESIPATTKLHTDRRATMKLSHVAQAFPCAAAFLMFAAGVGAAEVDISFTEYTSATACV
jgi:hypothetical protein